MRAIAIWLVKSSAIKSPFELYLRIVEIEDTIGHNRSGKWLPRELDIDIIFWAKNKEDNFNNCSPLSLQKKTFKYLTQVLLNAFF